MTYRDARPDPAERLATLHDHLIEAVAELTGSEAWARMLHTAARFPTYSPSNVLLIATQRPDATRVAGIRTWNRLGRHVLKGEHGIAILAPCTYPPRRETGSAEPTPSHPTPPATPPAAAGKPADPDRSPARELRGFKVAHVFDVTQTDGTPLPDVAPTPLSGQSPAHLWDQLAAQVTAAAYLVTATAGLDSLAYTVPYVANWSGGDLETLRSSATTVVRTSQAICRDLEAGTAQGSPSPVGGAVRSSDRTPARDAATLATARRAVSARASTLTA